MILEQPHHEAKIRQGVTTEVVGVDGNSYAPFFDPLEFRRFSELNAGLDGRPPQPEPWTSVAEYLASFEGRIPCNIAYFLGNSVPRIAAMGWRPGRAPEGAMERMKTIVR